MHIVALMIATLVAPAEAGGPEVMVLLNARNPTAKVSAAQLKQIYLGQSGFWHGVVPMKVVMRPLDSDPAKAFLGDVLDVTAQKYERTWSAKQLSGQGVTPPVAATQEQVVSMVAQQPGAISFVLAAEAWELPPTVKAVPVE